jgi:dihydrofolate reductase
MTGKWVSADQIIDIRGIEVVLIAAMADNHVIGRGDDLPWRIPADLKHFKATTLNHVMIMGSTTWRSFRGRALPNRRHIVLTTGRTPIDIHPDDVGNVTIATSLHMAFRDAREHAFQHDQKQVFVIGGQNVYEQTIGFADRMILTRVKGLHEGDKFFPILRWDNPARVIPRMNPETGGHLFESNGYEYSIWDYYRDAGDRA